ncbi:MAG: fluoride efflux transporter CrcB, partial [Candidatus Omnitrophica bacterium]|nr:fluoride efflux transporter CrcB [Candidatus Omnitrophota bacterium]
GVGSILRFLVAEGVQKLTGGVFPWGILAVNLIGCFAIGLLGSLLTGPWLVDEKYQAFILVGLLGGLTTFSSYAFQTIDLARGDDFVIALCNFLMSNFLGFVAVWIGLRLAQEMY